MATLRPVPKPQPKDDFWVEEYRKERSKSPMVQDGSEEASSAAVSDSARSVSPIPQPPPPMPVQRPLGEQKMSSPVQESEPVKMMSDYLFAPQFYNQFSFSCTWLK